MASRFAKHLLKCVHMYGVCVRWSGWTVALLRTAFAGPKHGPDMLQKLEMEAKSKHCLQHKQRGEHAEHGKSTSRKLI